MALSLEQLNTAPSAWLLQQLGGLYEHSPWIAEQALQQRPFVSLAQFKHAMAQVVTAASREAQLALVRAHPELAGRAMVSQALTAESTGEQSRAGLSECSPQEFDRLQQLNSAYNERFGHPFIVAVRGPRGDGLSRQQIIAIFERRLHNPVNTELCECLRNIHRIAEIRLDDKFGIVPALGNEVWDWHEALAEFSDPGYHEKGQLTVTYLTEAHQACAASLRERMLACGFDTVSTDAVGNVVGRYRASRPDAPTLMTGSHFDSVRNGGKYDGRLGIFVPMACVRHLHQSQQRLPFDLELVAFAEEEGQRYKATFLGSGALVGQFDDR
ncbi:MAG: 2-oxo-4-hydroxy-4-carboxy-5-ureidoimidazoline decarboxylase, partial [Betaproteobacteria bacterium]|nr:2-oxo-4-hydroxy-4-carboxy-5-ureidoimidazoline decarboxylase [Betaproteobacteria bacterium]